MSYVTAKAQSKPIGMSAAVIINGSIIAAIMLSPMVVNQFPSEPRTTIVDVPHQAPPPIDEKIEKPAEQRPLDPIYTPPTAVDNRPHQNDISTTTEPVTPEQPTFDGKGEETYAVDGGIKVEDEKAFTPLPIFAAAVRDPRWLKNFQPGYPSRLLAREIEGSAKVRVLIGTNGKVRQANLVSATHPEFGQATVDHALKSWRFKPATRDGVAVEDWQTLTVQFTITSANS